MSLIIDKVETFLQKCEYHPIRSGENEIIVKDLSGLNDDTAVSFNIRVWGDDVYDPCPGDDGRYVFPAHLIAESKFPITVPSNKRNKMVSLFNKINLEADVAWVALNMENGEICCKCIIRSVSIDALNDDIMEPWFYSPCEKLDALYPLIMDVINSEKTVEQIFNEGQVMGLQIRIPDFD